MFLISAASDDTAGTDTGIVHLFDGTTGALLQTFANPNPTTGGIGDGFGLSSSILGNNVLIGTPSADAGATDSGAAYLFDATTGALLQTFLNPTPSVFDSFGDSVAISGNNVLIGVTRDDTGAFNAGAAYLFDTTTCDADTSNGGTAADNICEAATLTILNPTPAVEDLFAFSLAISGNNVVVSAVADDTGAFNSGIAYLFDGTTGALLQTFLNPTPDAVDFFGISVAISENNVLIGASSDDTDGTDVGLAYLYTTTLPETPSELIDSIEDLGLPSNVENNLKAPLKNAQDKLDDSNPKNDGAACGKMDAFINQVNAQEGKKLSTEQADELREAAESVKESLGC